MLGVSTGQLLVILGACSIMMKPSDMIKIARVAGRMSGRAVGHLMLFRRQMDDILEQTAAKKVNKELKDAMTQLDSIRYEVQNLSRLTPSQFVMRQQNTAGMAEAGTHDATKAEEFRHEIRSMIRDEIERTNPNPFTRSLGNPDPIKNSVSMTETRKPDDCPTKLISKDMNLANTGSTDLQSQATMYARFTEAPGIKMSASCGEQFKENNGLLNVFPVSAESAGLLPSRSDEPKGSDLVLEALVEEDVAKKFKLFVSQPHDQLPKE